MESHELLLQAVVLLAALLQAATGIGFGVIAGPVILLVINDGAAIQVSIVLSFLIAAVLSPSLRGSVDKPALKLFLIGSAVGLPLGIVVFMNVGVDLLKLLAGLTVLFMAAAVAGLFGRAKTQGATPGPDFGVGVLSGVMCTSLAMPGPVPAAWMSARSLPKATIRATTLALFVFSYVAAFAFQAGLAGVVKETWWLTASLVPATLIGVFLGRMAVNWISEIAFRRLITIILAATAVTLLASVI